MENDLNEWSDSDLEYEICDRIADQMLNLSEELFKSDEYKNDLVRKSGELIYYLMEFRRRHPVTDEFDYNGNGRYV